MIFPFTEGEYNAVFAPKTVLRIIFAYSTIVYIIIDGKHPPTYSEMSKRPID
jgi:hypothetical protein